MDKHLFLKPQLIPVIFEPPFVFIPIFHHLIIFITPYPYLANTDLLITLIATAS